jgi:uncharacterized membrane protein
MRRHATAAALLVSLSLVAASPAATQASQPATVHAACKQAVIEGEHKCIARGQYCRHTKKANRDYHKYGYHCGKRDKNGRYHLVYH